MPNVPQDAPDALSPGWESSLIDARRTAIDGDCSSPRWGLALSGGGIRSATFSLGALQAIAEAKASPEAAPNNFNQPFKASLLSRFDYLSTVSGGGYIGALLSSLFIPRRLTSRSGTPSAAADDAVRVLSSGPPERIRTAAVGSDDELIHKPLAWLRENGRYLLPTGTGDISYTAAIAIRNWIAIHYVIATILITGLSFLLAARATLSNFEPFAHLEKLAFPGCPALGQIWWSPSFAIAALVLAGWIIPVGIAFWFTYQATTRSKKYAINPAEVGALLVVALLVALSAFDSRLDIRTQPSPSPDIGLQFAISARQIVWLGFATLVSLAIIVHRLSANKDQNVPAQRVRLTRWLSVGLITAGIALTISAIDTLGQSLYLLILEHKDWRIVAGQTGIMAALVWLTRKVSGFLGEARKSTLLTKIPLAMIGGAAGILIFLLISVLWSLALNSLIWSGSYPDISLLKEDKFLLIQVVFLAFLALAILTGQFPGFINLSSLQSFYSSRLTRAYLGASNAKRFTGSPKNRSVSEPLPDDNLHLSEFMTSTGELSTFAPLHIVNVTLCKTVDPAEQLVQRDRKGIPLAVLPFGFSVDGQMMPFRRTPPRSEIEQLPTLGQWVGTSGAAVSTGIGRETSLGMSLLMGAANIRLGTWWDSGQHKESASHGMGGAIASALGTAFKTQIYLGYELRARFFGMHRRWQYLTDGGHFENTGLYELLRPERRVEFIFASDNGADPQYRFDDLANLIRLARIDLKVQVTVMCDFSAYPVLNTYFGNTSDFSTTGNAGNNISSRCALLLRAKDMRDSSQPPCWIILLKPRVLEGSSADVRQYAAEHEDFPQQSTADQSFDEAQWESYRRLGYEATRAVLRPAVWTQLHDYMVANA